MRHIALCGAVALCTLILVHATAHADCGKAAGAAGSVTIKRVKGGEGTLKTGEDVCTGDTVTTGDESYATLHMPGDAGKKPNVLRVTAKSSITVEAYQNDGVKKKVLLNVLYGKMRATVNSKYDPDDKKNPQQFQVKTKSAVAGVRGTDFITSFTAPSGGGEPKMQVTTLEGRVEVGKPGPGGSISNPTQVSAGFRADVSGNGQVAQPRAVPAAELKKIDGETKSGPGAPGVGSTENQGGSPGAGEKEADGSDKSDAKAGSGETKGDVEGDGKSASSGDSKSSTREPASSVSGGGSMPIVADTGPLPPTAPLPLPPPLPVLPPVFRAPVCDICNRAVQSGPAKVNVKICIKGQVCP